MNRSEKSDVIELLRSELPNAASIVVGSAVNIPVNTINDLRNKLRAQGVKYRVVKNTLAIKAVEGTAAEPIASLLKGTTAVIYHADDPAISAKLILDFVGTNDKFNVRGGFVGGSVLNGDGVKALATLPGKDELRATLLSVFNGVSTKFVRTLAAAPTQMLNVLNARKDQLS